MGTKLRGPKLRRANLPSIFAPQSFGPCNLRPVEFWTPQSAPRGVLDPSKCAPRSFAALQSVTRFLQKTKLQKLKYLQKSTKN